MRRILILKSSPPIHKLESNHNMHFSILKHFENYMKGKTQIGENNT